MQKIWPLGYTIYTATVPLGEHNVITEIVAIHFMRPDARGKRGVRGESTDENRGM